MVDQVDNDGLIEKLISVTRTSKTVKGGRIFGFTALVAVGNTRGIIGIGRGKAREVPLAIQKAMAHARHRMIKVHLKVHLGGSTISHPITSQYGASTVIMLPARSGTGVIAGGAARPMLEAAGVTDIVVKIIGSSNPANVTRATLDGLMNAKSIDYIAAKRGKTVEDILVTEN